MKNIIVTTSWDDGHVMDLRLAKLMKKYGIAGTLYISPKNREFSSSDLLSDRQVKKLSLEFEIGAHTYSHPRLTEISVDEANQEIKNSKIYLEKLLGKRIVSFCYPGGQYNLTHVTQVKKAGFKMARTTKSFAFESGNKPFEIPTSVHVYDHWTDAWRVLVFCNFNLFKFFKFFRHWDVLAMAMFDQVDKNGGVFHLWGHSWEVDQYKNWERLEKVFKYISQRQEVRYLTNGKLV